MNYNAENERGVSMIYDTLDHAGQYRKLSGNLAKALDYLTGTELETVEAGRVEIDGERVFATQRGYGEFKDGWEFPGGKIEAGETPQEALKREIMEELDTKVKIGNLIDTIEYDYPNFHLLMDCFWCEIVSGELKLKEHENAKWLTKEHLDEVEWLPADVILIDKIRMDM